MTVSLGFALSMLLAALTAVQAPPEVSPDVQLLAFNCVELVPDDPSVVQFEREGFPPFSDTGLFASNGQQIAYVEQGSVTVFGDQIGREVGDEGFSVQADANSSLGIRNEELTPASVLWARIVPAFDRSEAAAYLSPNALRSLRAAPLAGQEQGGLPPLFFEFDLPDSSTMEQAYLFMARMELDSFARSDPVEGDADLTTSGIVAFVVEVGTLRVDDGTVARTLQAGEGMTVAGDGQYAFSPGESPTTAFVVGIVATDDEGRVGTEIKNAPTTDRLCPEAWSFAAPAPWESALAGVA